MSKIFNQLFYLVFFILIVEISNATIITQSSDLNIKFKNYSWSVKELENGVLECEIKLNKSKGMDDHISFVRPPERLKGKSKFDRNLQKSKISKNGCIKFNEKNNLNNGGEICFLEEKISNKKDATLMVEGLLALNFPNVTQIYGLGQQFMEVGAINQGLINQKLRKGGCEYGNSFDDFDGGKIGNTLIPVAYFLGKGEESFSIILDNHYAQEWNFQPNNWKVRLKGDSIKFYLIIGRNLEDLRRKNMEMVGKPKLPPKKFFGLWVSEFGYENWDEVSSKLKKLKDKEFPLDGFVLDAQWFGHNPKKSYSSSNLMGKLEFDDENFPKTEEKINSLLNDENIGLMVIEESYVNKNLKNHSDIENRRGLVEDKRALPQHQGLLLPVSWWGRGGMIDWSNTAAASVWHDSKRQPLIDMGILGHWIDLGEPDLYDPDNSIYHGIRGKNGKLYNRHMDIHNIYNLLWAKSIFDGYKAAGNSQRPFMMSRSGFMGIQKYGVAMWSGDISSTYRSFRSHINAQTNMSMSGIDYYGSDAGGFQRTGNAKKDGELYTTWLAYSAWFDIPLRPHVNNLSKLEKSSPAEIGDIKSNRKNILTRYRLIPYYYSLGYKAYKDGDAIFPPLSYYFHNDPHLRDITDQKMVGPYIMVALKTEEGQTKRKVYLPKGTWYNYYDSTKYYSSTGKIVNNQDFTKNGYFSHLAYVRGGAILPEMILKDKNSVDAFGNSRNKEFNTKDYVHFKIYPDPKKTSFLYYNDDGKTVRYESNDDPNAVKILIKQKILNNGDVKIDLINKGNFSLDNHPDLLLSFLGKYSDKNIIKSKGCTTENITINLVKYLKIVPNKDDFSCTVGLSNHNR